MLFFFGGGVVGSELPLVLAFAAVPVAVVVGVLRYNLLGIEVVAPPSRPSQGRRAQQRRPTAPRYGRPQVAAVVHAAGLAADLAQARQRVVSVALAERDRLRRDLHDGLGPSLTGMSLGLEAIQAALPADPAIATDVVARLRTEMRAAVAEIRRILAGLGPGILEERGLADALRHRARTAAEAGGLAVAVTIPETLPPLPSEIEVAAYRITDEALTNVVRHATAGNATITLNVDGHITLEISDDGRGLPPDTGDGIGLTSMRRRTQELGGQLLLDTSPGGGTRVLAHLPRTTP